METKHSEQNKIRQVAKDYEKNGYKVIVEPRGRDIPSFIDNYQPDIIATSEKDNVIVEVKSRADLVTIERLKDIAEIVNKKENWRFELIVTSSKQEAAVENARINIDLDIPEISRNLAQIKEFVDKDLLSAAFLFCWANLESLSRQLLLEDKKNLTNKTPLVLIKTMFSLGYLTRTDYDTLEKNFQIRNLLVHGYKAHKLDKKSVNRLISITEKLLIEKTTVDNE